MLHHITRATRHLIFWSLILAAIGLTGMRLLMSGIEHYKLELAAHIGEIVGTPVKIGHLGAKMRGFDPELVLKDIAISSVASAGSENPAIQFNEIRLGINLADMLAKRELLPSSWVTLVGAKLAVKRRLDGSAAIVGLKAGGGQPLWLMQGGKYEVLHSQITWQDETGNAKPLLFDGVDLAISNDGDHHLLNMLVKLPEKIGRHLRVSMDFKGDIFEPSTVQGRIYIDGKAVDLRGLADGFGFAQPAGCLNCRWLGKNGADGQIILNGGTGDFKIWADWRESQLVSMDVEAQAQQIMLARQGKPDLSVGQLKTRLHWFLTDASKGVNSQWQLDVNDFLLETQDVGGVAKKWPSAVFSMSVQPMGGEVLPKIALFVERLDLQEASWLAQFFAPLPEGPAKTLAQAKLRGEIERFSLFADLETKSVAVNGGFSKINVAPLLSAPGIENLTGHIKGDGQQGSISLMTKDAWLSSPGLFREVLPVNRLQGALNWRQTNDAWSVSSQMMALDSMSFQSNSRFHIDIPKSQNPVFMDLQSSFAGADASQVTHFLPVGIMDEDVVDWLDHAFTGGSMTNGGLLVYGDLTDFPFTTRPGVFEALFNAEHLDLSYAPQWPHITGMNAEVLFSQAGLKVDVRQGQSENVAIKQAEITIPSLNKSKQLLILGKAEGTIGQVLGFMQHTTLSSPVDSLLEAITPHGNTTVALDLKIPLAEGVPTKVDGAAKLDDARLTVKSLDLPVGKINGELKFNEQGVYSETIHATALGHPIQINISSTDSQTTVNVAGKAGIGDLQAQFDMPWWGIAKGETDYQLKLNLPYGNAAPELVVESMLSGVSLDLPESLAKSKAQSVPLSLSFGLNDKLFLPVTLNYDNKLKAAIKLDTVQKTIYSGQVLVGTGEAAQTQDAGLKLEINQDRLALQDWLGLAVAQGAGDGVRELKIHGEHALWKDTDIGVFDLALRHSDGFWAGAIASPIAKGNIKIPADFKNSDKISLDMELLDLFALKQAGSKDPLAPQILSPELVPLLSVISKKTLWRSTDLGRLSLSAERVPGGMTFKNVELAGENQKLVLSGDWLVQPGGQPSTHAQGHLDVPRAGQLLAQLGITKDLTETEAAIDFSVNWNAAPHQFSMALLKGQVDINFKAGRILSIEPGFGRLLGVLALAQWIKRAQLDFRDIYQEGLTFNSIKGHFELADGAATTHDLVVDAVPAKIAISGDTDLVAQTVDHIINVTPKSADAVPIAGTIMGKIAALVGRSLTGKDQEGFFFGSQYSVKGPWGNAQIIPMHNNDGLLQKTWTGITDFPWLQEEKK